MRILQLLNWNLKTITDLLPDISNQGFDTIQVGPLQPLKDNDVFGWWLVYQPIGFTINNMFGNKKQLIELTKKAKEYGIKITVDVVCNHVANTTDEKQLIPNKMVDPRILNNPNAFKRKQKMQKYDMRYCMINDCNGLPALDLKDKTNQRIIFHFLNELVKCGVSGFRFDAAKHIGLPNDGVDFFKKVQELVLKNNLIAYGEVLGGPKDYREEFCQYLDIHSRFDDYFPDKNKCVTFFESHDTYLHKVTKEISQNDITCIYNLLTGMYPKTLFYVRPLQTPYLEEIKNGDYSLEEMNNRNEVNYFDDSFLTDKRLKEANVKILKR